MAAYVPSARSDPYGLTADDFVGPPMGHPRGHCTAHEALAGREPTQDTKERRTEALEVPSDLRDMEIPLEDMGDDIVLTGL